MKSSPGGKTYQRNLIDIEGSPPRISRVVHPKKSCMDDQGTLGKTQTQKLSRYIRSKQGRVTQEEYRDALSAPRDVGRKAKAQV